MMRTGDPVLTYHLSPPTQVGIVRVAILYQLDVTRERDKVAGMTPTRMTNGTMYTDANTYPQVFYSGDDGFGITADFNGGPPSELGLAGLVTAVDELVAQAEGWYPHAVAAAMQPSQPTTTEPA